MVSIAVVNTVLNAVLWALHSVLAYVIESIYVMGARLELHHCGSTRATNADETDAVKWILHVLFPLGRSKSTRLHRRCCDGGPCGTTPWAVGLMISALLLLPAELIAESGIDVKESCGVTKVVQEDGVCAGRAFKGSALGTAANSLFIQRTPWMDTEWDILLAGSSRSMDRKEVRRLANIRFTLLNNSNILAKDCSSIASSCENCGSIVIQRTESAFGFKVVALRMPPGLPPGQEVITERLAGYVATDGKVHPGIVFQGLAGVFSNKKDSPVDIYRTSVRGIETVLTEKEYTNMIKSGNGTIDVKLDNTKTRIYNITCFLSGMNSTQFAEALAFYRKMQLDRPRKVQKSLLRFEQVAPLSKTEVLQAVFAYMADDLEATCRQPVNVYRPCGVYDWKRAVFTVAVTLLFLLLWIALFCKARDLDIVLPYDSSTWRRYALREDSRTGFQAEMQKTTVGSKVVVKMMNDLEDDCKGSEFP